MNKQKGFTVVELLVSVFLLIVILSSTFQFYEGYKSKTGGLGDTNTARNLAISASEYQIELTNLGVKSEGVVLTQVTYINDTKYSITSTKTKSNNLVSYYSNKVAFYKINTVVAYNGKKIEVNAYVTQK